MPDDSLIHKPSEIIIHYHHNGVVAVISEGAVIGAAGPAPESLAARVHITRDDCLVADDETSSFPLSEHYDNEDSRCLLPMAHSPSPETEQLRRETKLRLFQFAVDATAMNQTT